jgi:hypothetical protein
LEREKKELCVMIIYCTKNIRFMQENREVLLDASKKVDPEVNAEKKNNVQEAVQILAKAYAVESKGF